MVPSIFYRETTNNSSRLDIWGMGVPFRMKRKMNQGLETEFQLPQSILIPLLVEQPPIPIHPLETIYPEPWKRPPPLHLPVFLPRMENPILHVSHLHSFTDTSTNEDVTVSGNDAGSKLMANHSHTSNPKNIPPNPMYWPHSIYPEWDKSKWMNRIQRDVPSPSMLPNATTIYMQKLEIEPWIGSST
jgi:hypothetical protein